jgi:hypothetical protein
VTKKDEFAKSANDIATRAELYQRQAARPLPRAEPHLTPRGWETVVVHQETNLSNEERIRHLKDRMKNARENLNNNHARALVRGKARNDFDRER